MKKARAPASPPPCRPPSAAADFRQNSCQPLRLPIPTDVSPLPCPLQAQACCYSTPTGRTAPPRHPPHRPSTAPSCTNPPPPRRPPPLPSPAPRLRPYSPMPATDPPACSPFLRHRPLVVSCSPSSPRLPLPPRLRRSPPGASLLDIAVPFEGPRPREPDVSLLSTDLLTRRSSIAHLVAAFRPLAVSQQA